jgi:hypothetical protein
MQPSNVELSVFVLLGQLREQGGDVDSAEIDEVRVEPEILEHFSVVVFRAVVAQVQGPEVGVNHREVEPRGPERCIQTALGTVEHWSDVIPLGYDKIGPSLLFH